MAPIVLTKSTLRAFQPEDVPSLATHANNIKIWNQVRDHFPHPYTLEDAKEWIAFVNREDNQNSQWAITVDGLAVGGIGLLKKEGSNYRHSREMGYWLGEAHWGGGIISEAVTAVLGFGFKTLKLQRIYACCFEHNAGSRRVLEKCGFKAEGVFKNGVIKNEQLIDEYRFGILAEDFLRNE